MDPDFALQLYFLSNSGLQGKHVTAKFLKKPGAGAATAGNVIIFTPRTRKEKGNYMDRLLKQCE